MSHEIKLVTEQNVVFVYGPLAPNHNTYAVVGLNYVGATRELRASSHESFREEFHRKKGAHGDGVRM
jgi:hypothetical protein